MTKKVAPKKPATVTPIAAEHPTPKPAKDYVRKVVLQGTEYTLDFDLKALCDGENACIRQGHYVSLVFALNPATLNLNRLRNIWVCAIHRHHPALTYEEATELLQPENAFDVANVVFDVFQVKAA